jgi:hypothetical protein
MTEEGKTLGIAFGSIAVSIALVALVVGALHKPSGGNGAMGGAGTKLINRARMLLAYMSPQDAVRELVSTGVDKTDAYFAVKAAGVLLEEK